jgi:transketolase
MRPSFFNSLEELSEQRNDIIVLTGDLGFKLFDRYRDKFPNRFINVGVAESNMIGLASGLSLGGKNVYCYSIIPFLLMRTYEHIRIDIAYNNLSVKLVGVGGGFTYGLEGITHFGLEDLALMRMLPNMTVVVPADPIEASALARASVEHRGPLYIRLGRAGEPCIHEKSLEFKIGKPITLIEGKDIALVAIGNMVCTAQKVASDLKQKGLKPSLVNMHTIKPLNKKMILQLAATHEYIFTIEEHYKNGGLGSAILEVLADSGYKGKLVRIGIPEELGSFSGHPEFLRSRYGLTAESIFKRVMTVMEEKSDG